MDYRSEVVESQAVNIKNISICRAFIPYSISKLFYPRALHPPHHMSQVAEPVKQPVVDARSPEACPEINPLPCCIFYSFISRNFFSCYYGQCERYLIFFLNVKELKARFL